METSNIPDPNRIPSSVFARNKSGTQMEWSVASNESLFSIHAGNSSFSRDNIILMSKSGEFSPYPGSPMEAFPPPSPVPGANRQGSEELTSVAAAANAEAMKDVLRANAEEQAKKEQHSSEAATLPSSISHRSDESFAFPILTGERRSSSIKVEPAQPPKLEKTEPEKTEQLPEQNESPKAAPAAGERRWFSCFTCCSSCC